MALVVAGITVFDDGRITGKSQQVTVHQSPLATFIDHRGRRPR